MSLQTLQDGVATPIKKKDVGAVAVTLYTVATGVRATLQNISFCNTTAASATVSLYVTNSAVDYYRFNQLAVAAHTTEAMQNLEIPLISGDVLKVIASATAFDVIAALTENHAQRP